ncbi:hypothetical protein QPJ96_14800 [Pantoea agglomerans]|nr:hypothetical protein [Pantoea agglomerans]WIL41262.1 hypothetical protein QPJ96_14800 [Pantoea agglomerans]
MKKYPHGLTLNAVCAAIDDYQRHEDSVPEEGILAAFNTLLGHSDIADALRAMERTADANMAAAQAMRDDMYHWKQRAEAAEAAEAKLAELASEQKPFMYGIMTANGDAHFEDFCVSSDPGLLEDVIWEWNNTLADNEPKNRVVALFTRPAPAINLAELVPSKLEEKEGDYQSLRDEKRGYNACIAAILRNIEEAK